MVADFLLVVFVFLLGEAGMLLCLRPRWEDRVAKRDVDSERWEEADEEADQREAERCRAAGEWVEGEGEKGEAQECTEAMAAEGIQMQGSKIERAVSGLCSQGDGSQAGSYYGG
jgi:hypothetical protein